MNTLRTLTFAATTALAVATFALPAAQAQTTTQKQERQGGYGYGQMLGEQDRAALLDARMAGIRAGLNLTEDQNALFAPVEDAYRAMVESRRERIQERAEARHRGSGQNETRGTMRDQTAQERSERRSEMRARMRADRAERGDFMENLERRTARMTTSAAHLEDFTEAMRPFWESLDEDQRRLAPVLMHPRMIGARTGERRGWGHAHHGGRYGGHR
ncbi:MAG: hypothetical protein ACXIVE_03945 [Salinarimonas sp.]